MIGYSDDLDALRTAVAGLFERESDTGTLRSLWESETGRSPALWKGIVDIGITGIPHDDEDSDAPADEAMYVVLEEAGRYCVPDALLESIYLAGPAIAQSPSTRLTAEWLPRIVNGSARATVLLGQSRYVADAHLADVLVAELDGQVHLLTKEQFTATPIHVMDPSRRLFEVVVTAGDHTNLQLGAAQIEALHQRTQLGCAAILNGLAQAMLDRTIAYVKEREQFGRQIGTFQAIKHLIADAYGAVTLARLAGWSAAHDVASGVPEAGDSCLSAQIVAIEAEQQVNDVALQCHGGIGFTWEHDLQMWLKRGKAIERAYGSDRDAARRLGAARLG